MENINQQSVNTETTTQTNPTNPNSTKLHTKGVTIISSIISYISVPFIFFILTSQNSALISPMDDWEGNTYILGILVLGMSILLTIFWVVLSTRLIEKIRQGSRKALLILLAISIYIILTGNVLIYSNR